MRSSISKTVLAGLSALAVSATIALSSPAAAAFQFHGGGFGGFHGGGGFGGFHPGFGGFHPGFRPGFVGFHRPLFAGRRFFHPGFFRNGVWIDGWWGPTVLVSAGWGGYGGCWSYQPVYDAWGRYLGQNYVNVCW
jgi:hypothetical protein